MGRTSYSASTADTEMLKSDPPRRLANPPEGVDSGLAERGRGVGEGFRAVTGNFKHALNRSLHDDPRATLAIVAIVGFVLGTFWKA